ncbi:hypothetical protein SPAN111604_11630 [Sphingomonas antarctica]|uniref:hypothetical protein n=1 Tax=Sphingomonas antarctica TaxID=2040274 RepID=UPI0039EB867B
MNYGDHPVFATNTPDGQQFSADELTQIRRLLERLPTGEQPIGGERGYGDVALARQASAIVKLRRQIEAMFAGQVANDPSIDLLLTLFIHRARGAMLTVGEACLATSAPPTTALRRLTILTKNGHVQRVPHRHDKRTVYVTLSDSAAETMRLWLQAAQNIEAE